MDIETAETRGRLRRPKSLTEMAADELRARILDGQFQLGMALSENALAAELGISKTPVREALLQLKLEGLVDIHPQRGSFVFQLAAEQVIAITELREILELAALRLAMSRNRAALAAAATRCFEAMRQAYQAGDIPGYRRQDRLLHDAIIESAGNDYIRAAYAGVSFRVQALRGRLTRERALNEASFHEHRRIVERIVAGDETGVRRLLGRHINNTKQTYLDLLAGLPPTPPGRGLTRPRKRRAK